MRASAPAMFFLLILLALAMPSLADVVINEINPWGSSTSEWVELYNSGDETISIGNWTLGTTVSEKDATFPSNATIPAKGFFVVGDTGTGSDYEETISLSDDNISIMLRDQQNQTIDLVNLSNFFIKDKKGNNSIQRINSDANLSSNPETWLVSNPTKGTENLLQSAVLQVSQIFLPTEIFAGQPVLINVTVSNSGTADAEGQILILNSSPGFNSSSTFDISALSSKTISFDWTQESAGNFTICASVGNSSFCKEISAVSKPEKFTILTAVLNDSLMAGKEYTSLFRIDIENKSSLEGCSAKDAVAVYYTIFEPNGNGLLSSNFTTEVGCTKTAGTGTWAPEKSGNFTLCGRITSSTSRFDNTEICKNISVMDSGEIPCNLSLAIESKTALADGESDPFNITVNDSSGSCAGYPVEITYSIENSSGFISGYPKVTNKTVGQKNTFSFTPNLACGIAVYRLKANISKAFCNDSFTGDNFNEVLINITGKTGVCATPPVEKVKKKSAPIVSSGGEGGSAVPAANSNSELIVPEIIYLKSEVARGEEFTSTFSIKNNANKTLPVAAYSYAYDGKSCITGSWTANQIDFSLGIGETKTLSLKNKIKDTTNPGEYIFRFRVRAEWGNYDTDETITVTDKIVSAEDYSSMEELDASGNETSSDGPNLKIWNDTKLRINLTNCEGCMMEISGPNFSTATDKKYRVFDAAGQYNISVTRNGTLVLERTFDFKPSSALKAGKNGTNGDVSESNPGGTMPTGKFVNEGDTGGFFSRIISFLKNLLSPILSMMNSALAK